jgi:hypothetical protein
MVRVYNSLATQQSPIIRELRRIGDWKVFRDFNLAYFVFFLKDRAIANLYRHRTIADRPDYVAVAGARK